jgi:hypothetical protein
MELKARQSQRRAGQDRKARCSRAVLVLQRLRAVGWPPWARGVLEAWVRVSVSCIAEL